MQSQIATKNVLLRALLIDVHMYIAFYGCKKTAFVTAEETGFIQKLQPFFKDFSRTTFNFQKLPTRTIISQIAQKCRFPVYSKTLRLQLFASPTSLHFSVQLS